MPSNRGGRALRSGRGGNPGGRVLSSENPSTVSHYRLIDKLGEGGMGVVFLAEDTKLGRKVAIKLLSTERQSSPTAKRRFIGEARAAATLDHPNICSIYEVGEEGDGSFIVMQYLEGESLRARLRRGPMSLREALAVSVQIADALCEAHSKGIVHRDIKPENIFITSQGLVKVLDFGVAKALERGPVAKNEAVTLGATTPGTVIGTVNYMSPEQVRGEEVDARSDLFNLGLLLYEMISGDNPFSEPSAVDTMAAVLTREPPSLTEIGAEAQPELGEILRGTLAKNRQERYESAEAALSELAALHRRFEPTAEDSGRRTRLWDSAARDSLSSSTAASEVESPAEGRPRRRGLIWSAVLVATLILGTAAWWLGIGRSARDLPSGDAEPTATAGADSLDSIVVLPFANDAGDPELDYLSDGLTESLINSLSKLQHLKVMSRYTAFRYKGEDVNPAAVAQALDVHTVVTGRVRQLGDRLVVSLELVDGANRQLWGMRYEEPANDVVAVLGRISEDLSHQLRIELSSTESQMLTESHTASSDAYRQYVRGRYHYYKLTEEDLRRAIHYFEEAIRLDGNYALAYAGLALAYSTLGSNFVPPGEAIPQSNDYARQAILLDDSLADAHYVLALNSYKFDRDFAAAQQRYELVLELNPNYADAYSNYGALLWSLDRVEEGTRMIERAIALDPLSLVHNSYLQWSYFYERRFDDAAAQAQSTIELDAAFPSTYHFLAKVHALRGDLEAAQAAAAKAATLAPSDPLTVATFGYLDAVSGRREEALRSVQELERLASEVYVRPTEVAWICARLGLLDRAFSWLQRAYELRSPWILTLAVDPRTDDLRGDPRLTALLQQLGLPDSRGVKR